MYHKQAKECAVWPDLHTKGQEVERFEGKHRLHIRSMLGVFVVAGVFIMLVGALPAAAAAGRITKFTVPTAMSFPNGITNGPDGALWFTEAGAGKIGHVTTGGVVTEFTLAGGSSSGFGSHTITTGPDGALWFVEPNAGKIGRLTTAG